MNEISPEIIEKLISAVKEQAGGSSGNAQVPHSDEQADEALIAQYVEPLVDVINILVDKVNSLDEELNKLSCVVMDEIIGGITKLYGEKEKISNISGLSSKYGEKFGPYADFYKELSGRDIYEGAYDELEERKQQTPDWNDEKELSTIEELANMLKGKFEKIKGPVEAEIKIEKSDLPAEDVPGDKFANIKKAKKLMEAKGMKELF